MQRWQRDPVRRVTGRCDAQSSSRSSAHSQLSGLLLRNKRQSPCPLARRQCRLRLAVLREHRSLRDCGLGSEVSAGPCGVANRCFGPAARSSHTLSTRKIEVAATKPTIGVTRVGVAWTSQLSSVWKTTIAVRSTMDRLTGLLQLARPPYHTIPAPNSTTPACCRVATQVHHTIPITSTAILSDQHIHD